MSTDAEKFELDLQSVNISIDTIDDVDDVSDIIALFSAKYKIMPATDEFDEMFDQFCAQIFAKLKLTTIKRIRKYIDTYE